MKRRFYYMTVDAYGVHCVDEVGETDEPAPEEDVQKIAAYYPDMIYFCLDGPIPK